MVSVTYNSEMDAVESGSPLVVFTCQPNSHPFQERQVSVKEAVKVGRSVARARPGGNNAIFDCKVLSRNHALVWYEDNKFYLKDTKSSNGTFVNSQRLSKGAEESPAREVYSGDIIQFGVDVMENSLTHGCIIAQVSLYHPDGNEAKRKEEDVKSINGSTGYTSYTQEQVYQLAQYLQEALYREQALEKKLEALQKLLHNTQEASETGWQALLNEDRLLAKLELLESQLQLYVKNYPEDALRAEATRAIQERYEQERCSKGMLDRVLEEKTEAVRKLTDLERALSNSEEEVLHLREACEAVQEEFRQLSETYQTRLDEVDQLKGKLQEAESTHSTELDRMRSEKTILQSRLDDMTQEAQALTAQLERLEADKDFTEEQLNGFRNRLCELTDNQPSLLDEELIKLGHVLPQRPAAEGQEGPETDTTQVSLRDIEVTSSTDVSMTDDVASLRQSKKEALQGLMEAGEDRCDEASREVKEIEDQLEQAERECTEELDRICDLEDQLSLSESQMSTMVDSTMAGVTHQLSESHYQMDQTRSLTDLLQDEITWLERELSNRWSARSRQDTLTTRVEEVAPTNSDLSRIRDLLKQVLATQSRTEDTLLNYQNQISEMSKQIEEEGGAAVSTPPDTENMKHEIEDLRSQLAVKSADVQNAVDEAKSLRADIESERIKAETLSMELSDLSKVADHYRQEGLSMKARVNEAEFKLSTVGSGSEAATSDEMESLANECLSLRERIARIEAEMHASKAEHDELSAEYDRLQAEHRRLQESNMTDSQKEADITARQLEVARRRVNELEERCAEYESELTALRSTVGREYRELAGRTRMVSACAVIPVMVLLFAIMVSLYYHLTQ